MAEADDGTVLEPGDTADSAEDIAEASPMGWVPKDKYRSDPAKWVTAKEFLDKGRIVLPILRKQNQELHGELSTLRQKDVARETEMRSIKAALKAIEDSQEEDLADRVTATKLELEEGIAAASEAGDHRRLAKLTVDLTELVMAEKLKGQKPAKAATVETPQSAPVTPEHRAWMGENTDWYGKDEEKTRTAIAFGHVIAAEGKGGAAFYAELDKRLTKYYGTGAAPKTPDSKVAGGAPAGGGGGSGADEPKGFADLPKDAKDTCIRLERKMVGEGKPHKDKASWQKSYARQYHAQEEAR